MVKLRIDKNTAKVQKDVKVRKNVPMPEPRSSYPWRSMDIGDSFLFPDSYHIYSARSACYLAMKRTRRKFQVRETKEGLRCWRIK